MLSWAFAAVFMGTVGLASYQFGGSNAPVHGSLEFRDVAAGIPLPDAGNVETTASINGRRLPIEIIGQPNTTAYTGTGEQTQSQLEVMQREIVGLRRRLMDLTEQNRLYSKRIATLEKQAAVSKLAGLQPTAPMGSIAPDTNSEPEPGVVRTTTTQPPNPEAMLPVAPAPVSEDPPFVVSTKPDSSGTEVPLEERSAAPPRLISIYRDNRTTKPDPQAAPDLEEPVRIVTLPQPDLPQTDLPQTDIVTLPQPEPADQPVVTGSIPTAASDTLPETFDATPTRNRSEPSVITPSDPVGRLRGGSESQIKRSDFGAVIGHYTNTAAAAKAWADFKEQNEERMKDLRPLLFERQVPEGGISLIIGPFGNAADAAVACLHLLDVTELCHPALFAGDPLITAAQFRDSAFQ